MCLEFDYLKVVCVLMLVIWSFDSAFRISTLVARTLQTQPFYAKQTQFPETQNEHKPSINKGLCQYPPPKQPPKQTQFAPNPRKAEINSNFYYTGAYENIPILHYMITNQISNLISMVTKSYQSPALPNVQKTTQQKVTRIFAGFVLLWRGGWCIMAGCFAQVGWLQFDYVRRSAGCSD